MGCFWDETKYEGIPGVTSTECGYCGGKNQTVSYEQVCGGNTEHIEVVKVEFDPKIILKDIKIKLLSKSMGFIKRFLFRVKNLLVIVKIAFDSTYCIVN